MKAINKQDLINYLKKSPDNLNFNIFGTMLDDFRNTYETDEQIVNKIKGIITNIIEDGGSISPEDDTITELVDLITELLPEKMIIKPVGTLPITENGEYDVMNKAGVSVDVDGADLGLFVKNNVTTFEIPEGVITIPANTFKNYTNLETVVIPDSVTSIGENTFYGCTNLATVDGGCFVNSIDNNAFYGCPSSMSNDTVGQLKYSKYNNKITISGSGNLGNNAFQSNTSITDVIIHNGVTSIGDTAFSNCTSLTNVTIPDSVTSLGNFAFGDCTGLTSIIIPDSVTSIGDYAFYNCQHLTDIYYTGTEEEWNQITISSGNDSLTNATIHYNYTPSN